MTREPIDPLEITTDQERRKVFLQYVNRAWLILGIVTLALSPVFPERRGEFIFLIAVTFPTYLIIRFINQSGRTRLAGVIFTLVVNFGFYGLFMLLVSQLGAYQAFETEATVWMLMGLAVLFAGALVDKRAAPVLAALNSILLIGTRLMIAPESEPRPSILVFWWMMALTVWLYEGALHEALKRSWVEVTERKQAHKAIQEAELKYRMLVERLPVAVYNAELGANGVWHYISPQIETLLGFTPNEWMADAGLWLRQMHPDDREDQVELEEQAWERQETFEGEYRILTRDDRLIWVRDSAQILPPQQDGRAPIVQGVLMDITERKQAEEALRESESLLSEAQVIADMGSYVLDFTSGKWKSSAALDKIFGIDDAYIRSVEGWSNLIHPDHRQQMTDYFTDEVADKRIRFDREYKIIRKNDGAERWVHGMGELEVDMQDKLLKMHGVIQDITERKQAEDEIHQRVMELEMLYESGLAINQLLTPREIGQKVIELLEQKLGWHHATIRLYNPQNESLELLAFNQPDLKSEAEQFEAEERFNTLIASTAQGMSGWAVEHRQLVRSNDLGNDVRYVATYPGLQSGLYVPMKLGDRVIGVISIESEQSNAFSIADERLAVTLANQAASALENARLFEETARRYLEFSSLYETSKALSAENDLTALLQVIVNHTVSLLGISTGAIYLYNESTQDIVSVVAVSSGIPVGTHLNLGEGVSGRVAQTRLPMRVDDYSNWEGRSPKFEGQIYRAVLNVPVLFGGELIGVLAVNEMGESKRKFTEADEHLLSLFAAQAAGAIHSARLHEETARRAREFSSLYETSNALSTENELNAMLQIIVEHAKELLGSASSGMYLYLPETGELELTVDTTPYILFGTHLKLGEGAAGRVAQTRQPLRVDDYSTWEERSPTYDNVTIHAVLEVPMLYRGELIGVLTADETGDSMRKFTEADEHLLSLFASQAAGVIHSARLREQTARRLDQLQALHTIDQAISSSFDLRPILNTVISQTIVQLGVDAVDVLLFHPHLQTLEYITGQGFHTRAIEQTHLRLGEGFAGRAAFERRTVHIPNLSETRSNFIRADLLTGESFLEYYAVPLIAKGEIKGVLEVFHRTSLPHNPEWLEFLETLAGQAAITIDQTQLFDDLERANLELIIAYDATIEGWARAMDLRDRETENHTRRVTEMSLSLAKALGIKDNETLHIRRGALLHDIGKIGVPDKILLKDGKLTEKEWILMRQHPQFAYEMLQPIKYLRQSLDIPYCHHEKWDGTGYPRGLKGENIPLAARIFAIVDVWDAVTSDRPYRKGWSKQKALKYIREQSGKQFDPRVVDMFLEIFGSEGN